MYLEDTTLYLVTKDYSMWITGNQIIQWCNKYYEPKLLQNKNVKELFELITQKGHRDLFIKKLFNDNFI